ncbi:TraB/GumN family protein [Parasphingorhabdus sp. DH2-15]|uniref:TraB/GumN family protein n=1 Tax=Parasphingorhabdus sp. DH2-15 TaxID=3444112 RepID=UPI003F68792E
MRHFLILFMIAALAACSGPSPVTDDWADMPSKQEPALWQVSKGGKKAYLFGTIHALPADIMWYGPEIAKHFDTADILVMEIDAKVEGNAIGVALQQLGNTKGLGPVRQRIDPDLHDELTALQKAGGWEDGIFANREDWAAALALASMATQGLRVNGKYGVEKILGGKARSANKPIIALETATIQFGYFDRLAPEAQKAMLESVIAEAQNAKAAYRKLLANWLTGNVAELALSAKSGLMHTKDVRQSLLTDRNRDWHAKIIAIMNKGQTPFIAVGAAHLAGHDSVQQMLSESGYTITRLQ